MNKIIKIISIIFGFVILIVVIGSIWFINSIGNVSNDNSKIEFNVDKNDTFSTLGQKLIDKKLIKSEFSYKLYVKITKPTNLKIGTYELNQTMDLKKIIKTLSDEHSINPNMTNVTFREGLNMRQIATIISEKTNNKYDDVFTLLKDQNYLNELIKTYWFITDDIKNSKIYYSLEGYLFPDTYQIDKTKSVKEIFKIMLDRMNTELTKYKQDIEKSKYSIHELITLASIIELEAGSSHERSGVAGVFYNRLKDNWTLGSDVTTYYASKKTFKENLTSQELRACNAYNTRGTCFTGLPVGPISNPGSESIKGVMEPLNHNYYYFVADKNGKTYFNTNSSGHLATISQLKNSGLWYEYN